MRIGSPKNHFKPWKTVRMIFISAAMTIFAFGSLNGYAHGQELRNAIRDYRDDRVFNYQPSDPQTRGKVFNVHTKHYGRFYNCDHQEDKRNSPYICWKPHYENDFPPCLGFRENLRRDIAEIKQRISDGAGECQGSCNCRRCQPVRHRQISPACSTPSDCDCLQCATPNCSTETIAGASSSQVAKQSSFATQTKQPPRLAENFPGKKYGLLSGKIFQPTGIPQRDSGWAKKPDPVEIIPRLPLEELEEEPIQLAPRMAVTTHAKNPEASPPTPPPQIDPTPINGLRVVDQAEFWNRLR